jgi:hypothetical protein
MCSLRFQFGLYICLLICFFLNHSLPPSFDFQLFLTYLFKNAFVFCMRDILFGDVVFIYASSHQAIRLLKLALQSSKVATPMFSSKLYVHTRILSFMLCASK